MLIRIIICPQTSIESTKIIKLIDHTLWLRFKSRLIHQCVWVSKDYCHSIYLIKVKILLFKDNYWLVRSLYINIDYKPKSFVYKQYFGFFLQFFFGWFFLQLVTIFISRTSNFLISFVQRVIFIFFILESNSTCEQW